jgi:hypothetical protein
MQGSDFLGFKDAEATPVSYHEPVAFAAEEQKSTPVTLFIAIRAKIKLERRDTNRRYYK